jgi:triphosphoribosyl-dephospho-CoA synthase
VWPATVETYLRLLAAVPDTHIARKLGRPAAEAVSARAREVEQAGGVRTPQGRLALEAFDAELRSPTNSHNPGTTADLTCAALFVVILEGKRTR